MLRKTSTSICETVIVIWRIDPTFGQYPADASHIRFVIGGLAQQIEIVRLIGNLGIEVLE